jgi:hypothetical protein
VQTSLLKTSKPLKIRGFDVFVCGADGNDLSAIRRIDRTLSSTGYPANENKNAAGLKNQPETKKIFKFELNKIV